jgi:hypothetical protein
VAACSLPGPLPVSRLPPPNRRFCGLGLEPQKCLDLLAAPDLKRIVYATRRRASLILNYEFVTGIRIRVSRSLLPVGRIAAGMKTRDDKQGVIFDNKK